jgi:hypothetical protein
MKSSILFLFALAMFTSCQKEAKEQLGDNLSGREKEIFTEIWGHVQTDGNYFKVDETCEFVDTRTSNGEIRSFKVESVAPFVSGAEYEGAGIKFSGGGMYITVSEYTHPAHPDFTQLLLSCYVDGEFAMSAFVQ